MIPALYPYYLPPLQGVLGEQGAVAALLGLGGVLILTGAFLGPETGRVNLGSEQLADVHDYSGEDAAR